MLTGREPDLRLVTAALALMPKRTTELLAAVKG
jgi:hypothetical protein